MLHSHIFQFNPLETNCVVLWVDGNSRCTVADPGMSSPEGVERLTSFLKEKGLTPEAIILTHGHFDHVWGVSRLLELFQNPVYMHPADKDIMSLITGSFRGMENSFQFLRRQFDIEELYDGEELNLSGTKWKVLHTPGHTPGSVCFYSQEDNLLLSGDTLFAGSIGRTDLAGGDYDALMRSILDKLMTLPGETDVIPGHGQPTTLAREGMYNPFLQPFNEPQGDNPEDGIPIQGI